MTLRLLRSFLLIAGIAVGSCARADPALPDGSRGASWEVAGQFQLAPQTRFPPVGGLLLGGISGLSAGPSQDDVLGISDDKDGTRVFRFRLQGVGASFRVEPVDYIPLQRPTDPPRDLDPESIVRTNGGGLIVSSEGIGTREPRVPPALVEFGQHGDYVRQLEVRDRYAPNPTGPLVKGVRANFGFEALTITPDGETLFTAAETSLVQDGEVTTVDRGTLARMIEYVRRGDSFAPRREFAYPIEPVFKAGFPAGLAVNGLVDLLALGGGRLYAMERTYVEQAGKPGSGTNRIRIYHVDLRGATDISSIDSLRVAGGVVPVRKTLAVDFSTLKDLAPALAPNLDNFEGMIFGPPAADGRRTLLVVSDDNFNPLQRTWFVLLAGGRPGRLEQIQ